MAETSAQLRERMKGVTVVAPQHMRALKKANETRLARAEIKRQVAEGEATAAEVVHTCPWEVESMTIADLLICQHRWGRTRVRRFLARLPMIETKTIGSMTDRQRRLVVYTLNRDNEVEPTPDLFA